MINEMRVMLNILELKLQANVLEVISHLPINPLHSPVFTCLTFHGNRTLVEHYNLNGY